MRKLNTYECGIVSGGQRSAANEDAGVSGSSLAPISGGSYTIIAGSDTYNMQTFIDSNTGAMSGAGFDSAGHMMVDVAPPNDNMTPGTFGCVSVIGPEGFGGGVCTASNGHVYIEAAIGSPGYDFQAGSTNSLNDYLTGMSMSGEAGNAFIGGNDSSIAAGASYGTPGISVTYGIDGGTLGQVIDTIDTTAAIFSVYETNGATAGDFDFGGMSGTLPDKDNNQLD